MSAIQQALAAFLANSTSEQLEAELTKGIRPMLQHLDDSVLLYEQELCSFPAQVSFFQGTLEPEGTPERFPLLSAVEDTVCVAA